MTPTQTELVQQSWQQLAPFTTEVARLFYSRLFELESNLRPLFRGDMDEQGRKLMSMIGFAVASLGRLEALLPAVRALGERHARYGVRDHHYDIVAAALLWTLEKGLGAGFTAEVKEAWIAAYGVLASTMKQAKAADQRHAA